MADFKQLRAESEGHGEHNDCGVIACAVACGVTYATAHRALAEQGRRDRGRSAQGATERACSALGRTTRHLFGWDFTNETSATWVSLQPGHPLRKAKTMTTAEKVLRRHYAGRKFLIACRGHIAAFDGESLQDWTRGRRHHVVKIVEVI